MSIGSNPSHLAWVYNIYKNTGIKIPFPIIADRDGSISRMVYALQTTDKEKVVTPANWMPGCNVMIAPPKTFDELLARTKCNPELCCIDWYWCYKNS